MLAAPSYSSAACTRIAVRSGLLLAPWIALAEGLWIAVTAGSFVLDSLGLSTVVLRYMVYAAVMGAAVGRVLPFLVRRLPRRSAGALLFATMVTAFCAIEVGLYVFDIVAPFGSTPTAQLQRCAAGIVVLALMVAVIGGALVWRAWPVLQRPLHDATWPRVMLACLGEAAGVTVLLYLVATLPAQLDARAADGTASPNVLLIVLDTVRADALSASGNPLAHTPYLDQLAAEGVRFTRAVSTSTWTPPGHASLFTGLYPLSHGTRGRNIVLRADLDVLSVIFQHAGYATVSLYNNPLAGRLTGMDRGFNAAIGVEMDTKTSFVDERLYHRLVRGDSGAWETGQLLQAWVEACHRRHVPWLAFINLNDAHMPFSPRQPWMDELLQRSGVHREQVDLSAVWRVMSDGGLEEFRQGALRLSAADFAWMRAAYYSEVAAIDDQLRHTLESLRSQGLLDHTVVLITADHGEALGEDGELAHAHGLFVSVVRIPLILWAPKLVRARVDERWVSLVDVLPTLLELTGVQRRGGAYRLEGRSLLRADVPNEAVAEHTPLSVDTGDSFLLLRGAEGFRLNPHGQSTFWRNTDDSSGTWQETSLDAALAVTWRAELARWREDCLANLDGRAGVSPIQSKPALQERLRSLGYIP